MFTGQNILDFSKAFPDDDACLAYLADLKWRDGFVCKKCGHTSGCKKAGHKYHCYKCNHVETAKAGTLFHRVRFGIRKAFLIIFEMTTSTKSMSSIQMALRYGIRQPTAWTFMHKVREAMKSSQQFPLAELVHVDEFVVGGQEEGRKESKEEAIIPIKQRLLWLLNYLKNKKLSAFILKLLTTTQPSLSRPYSLNTSAPVLKL